MSFAGDLNEFRLKFEAKSSDLIQGVEIDLYSVVVFDSPVDTGRFRANWQASFDTPAMTSLIEFDPSGQATVAKMEAVIRSRDGGRISFFVNNLEYAIPLEYGHSQQAPDGMVRRNVTRFQQLVDEQAVRHKL